MKKMILAVLVLGLVAWPSGQVTKAQGPALDVIVVERNIHNADPSSEFASLKALPVVVLVDTQVGHVAGFANRHDWVLSEDGEDAKLFGIDDFFEISFDLVLLGTPIAPRKEAGIIVGGGQFIVNTDAHEVVAFGFPVPFFAFPAEYDSGETITMGVRYFRGEDGKRKLEFRANDQSSGPLDFNNLEGGFPSGFDVRGYVQVNLKEGDLSNHAVAVFDNIRFNGNLLGQ